MIYAYSCAACPGSQFDVVLPMSESSSPQPCPSCQGPGHRIITSFQFTGASDWGKEEWNPAFGCVVKNKKHRDELAKRYDLIEVGNEKPERIHEQMDRQREEKAKQRWDDAMREKVYE